MVWGYACGLDIIVRLFFVPFSTLWTLVIFRPQCIDSGYLVSAAPHTILYRSFWNFVHVFPMVWRCACGLDIILDLIFVTFSTLWTLAFSDLRFYESVETVGTLWAQLLIQFYTDLYETLHMFLPWSGDVHFVNFVIFRRCDFNFKVWSILLWLIVHILWNQLLLEFSLDLFNTLQICYRHIEDVHEEVWWWKNIFWQTYRVFDLAIFGWLHQVNNGW